jgi:uncharacterized protein
VIIRVSDLDDEGLTFDAPSALASAFSDPAWRLERVHLQVQPDGPEVLVHGEVVATIPQTCGRCTEDFPARVQIPIEVRLEPRPSSADSIKLGRDDLDVDFYTDGQVDLGRLVEAETMLALPMKPLCREQCRGLCPVCGVNRNQTECACDARPADPRLAVLRDLRARLNS